ncbi:MAG TPA: thiamine phosphate synthase [Bacillota bacterium]|nr:thiamine phosphate synthase [Bacillota bacterium]
MPDKFNLELYVVTDRTWLNQATSGAKSLEEQVEQAIGGGATLVQLREKTLTTGDFIQTAVNVKKVTDRYRIPLIINDRLDVALAVDAAGLHVGQSDMPAATARRLLGPGKILGVSVTTCSEALTAEQDGADYLGAGAVFPTDTKKDSLVVDYQELKEITRAVGIPVVAIGGINEMNALMLKGSGIQGIAVVSAIFSKNDIRAAAKTMKNLATQVCL